MPPDAPSSSFASDNASGVHPDVLAAMTAANVGGALAYGADPWTSRARAAFRDLFGVPADVFFTWGGTGANVVGLQCLLAPYEAVLCPESAHINVDECGAPERFTGSKLIGIPTPDGKLRPDQIVEQLHVLGDEHHVQPRVVSITQSTEMGTLYQPDEIAALVDTAHRHGLLVHLDGARIANATAALGGDIRSFTVDAGVDVLTFGGTKNGLMYGEAVVFLTPGLGGAARFVRKQAAQLPSKMRYVSAQFEALLADDLWLRNAGHANAMAKRLADRVAGIDGVAVQRRPEVNAVFATVPRDTLAALQAWSFFWVWDEATTEVRWMTSFDTTEADIGVFADGVASLVDEHARL
ncbi:MAG TPA: aminotransferase class V-fold PLP-dependent enzyme [Acidimicrobiales bacterium]